MKHLLLFFLFSGSLDSFSQSVDTTQPLRQFDADRWGISASDSSVRILMKADFYQPDTLRATLIVYHDGAASLVHTMPGFVVRQYGKDEIYLDDRMRLVKSPMEVLSYKLKR